LIAVTKPIFALWGFQTVSHPVRGHPIWVPVGLGLDQETTSMGLAFIDPAQRVRLNYDSIGMSLSDGYAAALEGAKGAKIVYQSLGASFFVVISERDGATRYSCFYRDVGGILGFTFTWRDAPFLHGDRLNTLILSSFSIDMTGAPPMTIPNFSGHTPAASASPAAPAARPSTAAAPAAPAAPALPAPPASAATTAAPASPAASAAPGSTKEPKQAEIFFGTGIFINGDGSVLTNAHVVEGCEFVDIAADLYSPSRSQVVARDQINDLALVKTQLKPNRIGVLRGGVRVGEPVEAFGYALTSVLSRNGNFTLGNVTALAGILDDTRFFQVSAPLQSGDSGGPLLDQSGNLIGILTAKLNAIEMAAATGDIPQNVNFAIKAHMVEGFLDSNQVPYDTGAVSPPLAPSDLAERAKALSVSIKCAPP
jgi:serine protease Do